MLGFKAGLDKKKDPVKLEAQKKSCIAMTGAERADEGILTGSI